MQRPCRHFRGIFSCDCRLFRGLLLRHAFLSGTLTSNEAASKPPSPEEGEIFFFAWLSPWQLRLGLPLLQLGGYAEDSLHEVLQVSAGCHHRSAIDWIVFVMIDIESLETVEWPAHGLRDPRSTSSIDQTLVIGDSATLTADWQTSYVSEKYPVIVMLIALLLALSLWLLLRWIGCKADPASRLQFCN
jgi:hypothetical protein